MEADIDNDNEVENDIPANYEVEEDGGNRGEFERGYKHAFTIGFTDSELALELKNEMVVDSSLAEGLLEGFREFFRQREKENERMSELEQLRSSRDHRSPDIER